MLDSFLKVRKVLSIIDGEKSIYMIYYIWMDTRRGGCWYFLDMCVFTCLSFFLGDWGIGVPLNFLPAYEQTKQQLAVSCSMFEIIERVGFFVLVSLLL